MAEDAPDARCDHHDAHVGVALHELEEHSPCDWCEKDAWFALSKSDRHVLVLCEECRTLIGALAGDEEDDRR